MPTLDTARVYPGGCLIEGTNLSEGRGTTRPFELDRRAVPRRAARSRGRSTRRGFPASRFRPVAFTPAFQKWQGRRGAKGVQVHVTDRRASGSFSTSVALIAEARRQAPRHFQWRRPPYEFEWKKLPIDLLCGGPEIRRAIERGRAAVAPDRELDGRPRPLRPRPPALSPVSVSPQS